MQITAVRISILEFMLNITMTSSQNNSLLKQAQINWTGRSVRDNPCYDYSAIFSISIVSIQSPFSFDMSIWFIASKCEEINDCIQLLKRKENWRHFVCGIKTAFRAQYLLNFCWKHDSNECGLVGGSNEVLFKVIQCPSMYSYIPLTP